GVTEDYGAHSFVVDGYDKEGRVHVVYGLGGGDGFYDLNKIRYRYGRSMTINVRPPKTTGISTKEVVKSPGPETVDYYLMDGTHTKRPRKGVNIVRTKGNKVQKIVIR
ncbi:MAG: hypothetical protein ACFN4H_02105, partial [Prevotella sp.]